MRKSNNVDHFKEFLIFCFVIGWFIVHDLKSGYIMDYIDSFQDILVELNEEFELEWEDQYIGEILMLLKLTYWTISFLLLIMAIYVSKWINKGDGFKELDRINKY